MAHPPNYALTPQRQGKLVTIVLVFIMSAAFGGFLVGTRQAVSQPWEARASVSAQRTGDNVMEAVVYTQMECRIRGPNRDFRNDLSKLVSRAPDLMAAVSNDPVERAYMLMARASRRAFDGAPPTIPHPVDDNDTASCTACHAEGREIAGRIAPRMSHKLFVNCTQCHSPVSNPGIGPEMPMDLQFVGLASAGRGPRAWPGAPPLIPHRTQMREDCNSCHGPLGLAGIRTPHPWRVNCMQCHAGSAEADGYLFAVEGEIGRPVLPPSPTPN